MNKEEYKDYLKLSGKITEKLDNTATYENWLIIQEYIDRAQQKVEQLENIRKETIEFINEWLFEAGGNGADMDYDTIVDLLNILNKGE